MPAVVTSAVMTTVFVVLAAMSPQLQVSRSALEERHGPQGHARAAGQRGCVGDGVTGRDARGTDLGDDGRRARDRSSLQLAVLGATVNVRVVQRRVVRGSGDAIRAVPGAPVEL